MTERSHTDTHWAAHIIFRKSSYVLTFLFQIKKPFCSFVVGNSLSVTQQLFIYHNVCLDKVCFSVQTIFWSYMCLRGNLFIDPSSLVNCIIRNYCFIQLGSADKSRSSNFILCGLKKFLKSLKLNWWTCKNPEIWNKMKIVFTPTNSHY